MKKNVNICQAKSCLISEILNFCHCEYNTLKIYYILIVLFDIGF